MNSKALHVSLFCFGLSGRKEDGKMETLELVNKEKQLCTLFCTFRCCHCTTTARKCLIFTFYGRRKQTKTKFSLSFLTS